MWLTIHLIAAALLVLTVLFALISKQQKRIIQWIITSRFLYIVLLATGAILMYFTFNFRPVTSIVKFVLAIALIAAIEINFARKQERKVTAPLVGGLFGMFVLTIGLGLFMAWF